MADKSHVSLGGSRGESHSAYFTEGGDLVVEWYDHPEEGPYESANMLCFDVEQQKALGAVLGLKTLSDVNRLDLLRSVAARFRSYWDVQSFAKAAGLEFSKKVDFRRNALKFGR